MPATKVQRKPAPKTAKRAKPVAVTVNGVKAAGKRLPTKVTSLHGTALKPVPPVGTAKYTRGVDLVSVADIDEPQLASWMREASARPGLGAKKVAA